MQGLSEVRLKDGVRFHLIIGDRVRFEHRKHIDEVHVVQRITQHSVAAKSLKTGAMAVATETCFILHYPEKEAFMYEDKDE